MSDSRDTKGLQKTLNLYCCPCIFLRDMIIIRKQLLYVSIYYSIICFLNNLEKRRKDSKDSKDSNIINSLK